MNQSGEDYLLVSGMEAYELGEIEALIWRLCDGTHSVPDIAEQITKEYDVAADIALADAEFFVGQLKSAGLLE